MKKNESRKAFIRLTVRKSFLAVLPKSFPDGPYKYFISLSLYKY
jgi:hypothetical protein